MNKAVIAVILILLVIIISGFNIIRNVLITSINIRLDSSEAVVFNEISSRLYRDFNEYPAPTDISWSSSSFEYRNKDGDVVQLNSVNDKVRITIHREDGTKWNGQSAGNILVEELTSIEIPKENIKVDLSNTQSKIYAITFKVVDNYNKKRISLNREYTSYYSVIKGDLE